VRLDEARPRKIGEQLMLPFEEAGGTRVGDGSGEVASASRGDERPGTCRLMEEVVSRPNLQAALKKVKQNKGSAGIDGMTVEELPEHLRRNWPRIREELLSGRYRPQAVQRQTIPKPGGGERELGIPTVLDRFLQQAMLQVLQPRFDPGFSDHSYGFRPGRRAHDAVRRARDYVQDGRRFVVDVDLSKFFDRVNHDILMGRLAKRIADRRILALIRRYLEAGVMVSGVVVERREGTPQGGPLSPLLANLLLDEVDKELEKRGHAFVRYADDCNVYVRSEAAGGRVMASLECFLEKRLRLKVNRDKSAVERPWKRKFLGYSVTVNREPKLRIAGQSVKRLRAKLRPVFRRGRGRSLAGTIEELGPVLRGWVAYFRMAEVKASFAELDAWVRRRLRCIVWRQWKTPRTRRRKLVKLGVWADLAAAGAYGGRGPWHNSGAHHMKLAVPNETLRRMGLVSLLEEHQRLARST